MQIDSLQTKIRSKFTNEDEELFINSFMLYLNHNQETEYIIDLDNVYEWLGFSQKVKCKEFN